MSVGDTILIVDDEPDIPRLLHSYLRREGLVPLVASTGAEAVAKAREEQPALIVLDIMLPDFDGFEVCRRVRRFADCPIIFLTARTEEADKILGLGLGADDYVVKPFSPRELIERIKANLRRSAHSRGHDGMAGFRIIPSVAEAPGAMPSTWIGQESSTNTTSSVCGIDNPSATSRFCGINSASASSARGIDNVDAASRACCINSASATSAWNIDNTGAASSAGSAYSTSSEASSANDGTSTSGASGIAGTRVSGTSGIAGTNVSGTNSMAGASSTNYRINASSAKPRRAVFDDCVLDLESYQLIVRGSEVQITSKEFCLLKQLVTNANRVFTKKQLFESVWEEEWGGDDNTIMVHIHRLRQKIEADPSAPKRIVTIRGIGYKFAGEVDWIAD
jgi:DNA-binding response OmpR family regulator